MARLERRLRKLETRLRDRDSGLMPYTPQWLEYWTEKLDRAMKGENIDEKIPLAAYDAMKGATVASAKESTQFDSERVGQ
jgi:hypothetical protein